MTWLDGEALRRALLGVFGVGSLVGAFTTVSCSEDGGGAAPPGGLGGAPLGGAGGEGGGGRPGPEEAIGCENRNGDGADVVARGAIEEDTTWSGTVRLEGSVTVTGAVLEIAEGTDIIAAPGAELVVGEGGALVAAGSAKAAVRFCGAREAAGFWKGLRVEGSAGTGTELSYVLVADAGEDEGALLLEGAALVKNLSVQNSGADGVRAAAFAEGSARLSVKGAEGAAVVLTHAAAVSPFPVGGNLTGNGDDAVRLRFETVPVDATFVDPGVPYVVEESIQGGPGAIRIEAGARFLFEEDTALVVGFKEEQSLTIAGTEESPVIFEGVEHTPGFFQGLFLREETLSSSTLSHLVIRDGSTPLSTSAAVRLDDVLFEGNQGPVAFYPPGLAPGSSGVTVRGTAGFPLAAYGVAAYQLPEQILLEDNQQDVVLLRDSSPSPLFGDLTLNESGTIRDVGVPYLVAETLDVSATVTVAAGVTLLGQWADSSLRVYDGGALVLEGTADRPIVLGPPDRTFTRPASFITVEATASEEDTRLSHVALSGAETCLTLHCPVQVADSSFADCSLYAIRGNTTNPPGHTAGDYTALMSGNTFDSASNGADESYGAF
ncbi:MAG: hypothetical protein GX607_17865 [Myxococcales bacterium]|nr:hypothetical protein [Myxococcales bacterium]